MKEKKGFFMKHRVHTLGINFAYVVDLIQPNSTNV